jgi:hypothetical protein
MMFFKFRKTQVEDDIDDLDNFDDWDDFGLKTQALMMPHLNQNPAKQLPQSKAAFLVA